MGERISGSFGEIENVVNEMDWHLFPIQTQRLMLMLLMGTQRPVTFMGYGNFPAKRITMKSVSFYYYFKNYESFDVVNLLNI